MSPRTNPTLTKALDREACSIGKALTGHLRARVVAMQSETNLAGAIELAKQLGMKASYIKVKLKPRVLKAPKVSK